MIASFLGSNSILEHLSLTLPLDIFPHVSHSLVSSVTFTEACNT